MQIKTITTAAGVNEIDLGNDSSQSTAHFYWLKNLGNSTLYVSVNPNPVAEKDDVAELPAKGAVSVETDEGKIYVLGVGKVEIHRTNSKFCPFELAASGSGGENIKFLEFDTTIGMNGYFDTGLAVTNTTIISVLCSDPSYIVGFAWQTDEHINWCCSFYHTHDLSIFKSNVKGVIYYIDESEGAAVVPGSNDRGVNYSTDEQLIGAWIDGSPLYQRTIVFDVDKSKEWIKVSLGDGVYNVISHNSYIEFADGSVNVPIPTYRFSGEFVQIVFVPTRNDGGVNYSTVELYTESDSYLGTCYSTIRYTKR